MENKKNNSKNSKNTNNKNDILKYFIKNSDLQKNEFFSYRKSRIANKKQSEIK